MAIYTYETDDGELHELLMTSDEKERREAEVDQPDEFGGNIRLDDGRIARRNIAVDLAPRRIATPWPLVSMGLGVGAHQISAAEKWHADHGVPTEFVKSGPNAGDASLRDTAHRNAVMELRGYHDRDAGYSQRTPGRPRDVDD